MASSWANPCPVCGRTKDGDCRISTDGLQVVCHHPKEYTPGEVINGWAFTGNTRDDRAGHFTLDKSRGEQAQPGLRKVVQFPHKQQPAPIAGSINLALISQINASNNPSDPESWRQHVQSIAHAHLFRWLKPDEWLDKIKECGYSPQRYYYGGDALWVERIEPPGKKGKAFRVFHSGQCGPIAGAGPDPWPVYNDGLATANGINGLWLLEVEGEMTADWAVLGGLVAISQPGHAHKVDQIVERYRNLQAAGVAGIVYLADNDDEGKRRAHQAVEAAAEVQLPLMVLQAIEVWPDLPVGGSIDDAPGTPSERVAALLAAIPAALNCHEQQRELVATASQAEPQRRQLLSMAEVGDRLREVITEGVGEAELAALVAELATAAEQSSINVQRLVDAIRSEQRQTAEVHAEAATIAAEADRQEIGRQLTASYLLPPTIAAALETRVRYLPCDGPSAVLPFLAAVAGLVKLGTEVEGSAVAGYRVPINLFACLVARSGAKKSPIGRLLVDAPTQALRAELTRSNRREWEAWEEVCRQLKKGEPRPPEPRAKSIRATDYTGESLTDQLQVLEAAGLGLLIYRDELSGLFKSFNQYKGGRGADEQQLLELFDGGGLISLRISGSRSYERSQVSAYGTTQPDVLRQLVADGDASGLWARFLFVPLPERAVPLPLATSVTEVAEVEAAAQTLADACRAVYQLPPQTYRLAAAAAERFASYELNRQRAALGASIGAQSALYGKSAGKVLRLAGLLHLLQIVAGELSNHELIEPATIDCAAALVDHLDAWALGLHAEVAAGGMGGLMRTIHRAAESAGRPIRWREVQNRLSRTQRKETGPAAVAEAMRALAAAGYGEVDTGNRGATSYRAIRPLP